MKKLILSSIIAVVLLATLVIGSTKLDADGAATSFTIKENQSLTLNFTVSAEAVPAKASAATRRVMIRFRMVAPSDSMLRSAIHKRSAKRPLAEHSAANSRRSGLRLNYKSTTPICCK